ncbi:hypothetical protein TSUD_411920 [Trifolium subterraneum]|uniref:RNase H type-1 domain-containing protein n=1 Tax=Trifolium subterraneum TaxID=3900 RepID=A0A2Z6PKE9_TRISU|nr:hypothetical protein TSUD_411920 [Trifolium subterraneum]
MLQDFTEQFLVTFAMTAWSLWWKRNVKLWEQQTESVDHVLARADYTLQTWMCAQNKQQRINSVCHSQVEHWQPHPTAFVKCNIDDAVFAPEQKATTGACLRNEKGEFITAFSCYTSVVLTPAEAEAWGLLQGLEWIATMGYNIVIF